MAGLIYYFCTPPHSYTLGIFATLYARDSARWIRIIPYPGLLTLPAFGPGSFVFSDLDRLSHEGRARLAGLADHLAASGCRVLNHPTRSLGRFDLLRMLHDRGTNHFNVYRLDEWRSAGRFPVFIRRENEHGRAVTGLIEHAAALERIVERMAAAPNAPDDLMIVEFGNVPAADGRYRKYAAFRVGDRVYGQHCYASEDWWVKFASSDHRPKAMREHDDYIRDNPHAAELAEIFALCDIDYGRADYCVVDGAVQIFEINTNPTIVHATSSALIDVSLYASLHERAMVELAAAGSGPPSTPNPLFEGKTTRDALAIHADALRNIRTEWPSQH